MAAGWHGRVPWTFTTGSCESPVEAGFTRFAAQTLY